MTFIYVVLYVQYGRSPIHLACMYGHIDTITELVQLGADIHKEDEVRAFPRPLNMRNINRCIFLSYKPEPFCI